MDVSLQHYRSSIGSFLPKQNNSVVLENLENNGKIPGIKMPIKKTCLIACAIFNPVLFVLHQPPILHHYNQLYSHPSYPTAYLQTNYMQSTVTTGLHLIFLSFIPPHIGHTLHGHLLHIHYQPPYLKYQL